MRLQRFFGDPNVWTQEAIVLTLILTTIGHSNLHERVPTEGQGREERLTLT